MQRQRDAKALTELEQTRTLHFHPVDLLRAIKRGTGGRDIQELRAALERLTSTYVKTNIREHHQGRQKQGGFTWLDSWTEVKSDAIPGKERTIGFTITLSHWFYRGVVDQRLLLAMEPEYFDLTGGYERWLWRVARKHAHGAPGGWSFTLATLHQKSGSEAPKKAFKRDLKRLAEKGDILGYGIEWQERGRGEDPIIRLYPNPDHERNQRLAAVHEKRAVKKAAVKALQAEPDRFRDLLSPRALTAIVARYPDIDLEDMMNRFMRWNTERGTTPRNVARAFEGFIRTHQNRQR
jgi:plasmid replication initiation protein